MSNRPETSAATYFERTECVAGVQDMRFQEMMPDVLSWLGITRIDKFVSMSDMKFEPIVQAGIQVVERVAIPDERIPADAVCQLPRLNVEPVRQGSNGILTNWLRLR